MTALLEEFYDSNDYFECGSCEALDFPKPDRKPVYTFTGHTDEVFSLACSPTDATLVATGGGDARGFLWIGQGNRASELRGHSDSVSSLAFSYDGKFLASGSMDGIVQVWDVYGNLRSVLNGPNGGIEWLRWNPRGHALLAGSDDSTAWMWNADENSLLNVFSGHGGSVTCGDFKPDGDPYGSYHTAGLTCMSISSTSTLALTGSVDGSVHIVNINTGRVIDTLASHSESVECVGFAPSDSWAAVGSMDKKLIVWDIEHSLSRGTFDHEGGVTCLAWLGESYVATGCVDGKVRLWDSRSAECVITFSGHSDIIQSIEVSANREYLVSTSLDSTSCVFDVKGLQ